MSNFIEDLDNVDKYAWGAAMLAFLYQGLKQRKKEDKTIDGFVWLIMGFFFHHFKGLYEIFNVAQEQQPQMPMLASLIKALAPVGANHHWKGKYKLYVKLGEVHKLLQPPNEDAALPIEWHPYVPSMLPPHLVDQIRHYTVISPLFCYNYVEYHLPHIVAKQFESLKEINLSDVGFGLQPIVHKANKGRREINFKTHYENQIKEWEEASPIGHEEEASRIGHEKEESPLTEEGGSGFLHDDVEHNPVVVEEASRIGHEEEASPLNEEGGSGFLHDDVELEPNVGNKAAQKKQRKHRLATPPSQILVGPRKNLGDT